MIDVDTRRPEVKSFASAPMPSRPDATDLRPAATEPRPAPARSPWWFGPLVVAAAWGVLLVRRPSAFFRPQFWAEDFFFLTAAEKLGVTSFWTPQAGYLHLIPRAIAWPATCLDPLWQPAFFLIGSLLVVAWVVLACLSPRHDLPWKPWLAAAVVLVPHNGEVFFNPTNAQWLATLGLLLTTLKRDPVRPSDWAVDLSFVVFAGFSGPFVILALPLFARRWWHRRTMASAILGALALLAAAAQGWEVMHTPGFETYVGAFRAGDYVANMSFRLLDALFFGALPVTRLGRAADTLLALALSGLLIASLWRAHRARIQAGSVGGAAADFGWLLGFAVVMLVAGSWRTRVDLFPFGEALNADRYFYVPKVILLWTTGGMIAVLPPGAVTRRVLVVLLIASMALNLPLFRFQEFHHGNWYAVCPDIRAGNTVVVNIKPNWVFAYRRGSYVRLLRP